ncbi:hypothetical protein M8J75_004841 [Diaphorina citri]|nr:hypothetical protein M8J75_004841 [Diaphorina citri]
MKMKILPILADKISAREKQTYEFDIEEEVLRFQDKLKEIEHHTVPFFRRRNGFQIMHLANRNRNRSDFHLCFLQWSVNYEKIAELSMPGNVRAIVKWDRDNLMTNQISEWKAITVSVSLRHQMLAVPSGLIVFVSSELLLIIV